jgi:hypothetical protein
MWKHHVFIAGQADAVSRAEHSSAGNHPVTAASTSIEEETTLETAIYERYNDAALVKKQRSIRLVVRKAEEQHLMVRQTVVTPDSSSRPSVSNQQSSASPQTASHQGPVVAAMCVFPATKRVILDQSG